VIVRISIRVKQKAARCNLIRRPHPIRAARLSRVVRYLSLDRVKEFLKTACLRACDGNFPSHVSDANHEKLKKPPLTQKPPYLSRPVVHLPLSSPSNSAGIYNMGFTDLSSDAGLTRMDLPYPLYSLQMTGTKDGAPLTKVSRT